MAETVAQTLDDIERLLSPFGYVGMKRKGLIRRRCEESKPTTDRVEARTSEAGPSATCDAMDEDSVPLQKSSECCHNSAQLMKLPKTPP
ncbi:hypothetical protein BGZ58_011271, partial [Dissophora ornata]